jgi:hypothetical protein
MDFQGKPKTQARSYQIQPHRVKIWRPFCAMQKFEYALQSDKKSLKTNIYVQVADIIPVLSRM